MPIVGYAPIHADPSTGEVFVQQQDVAGALDAGDDSGRFRPFGMLQSPATRYAHKQQDATRTLDRANQYAMRHGLGAYADSPVSHNIAGPGATLDSARRAGVVNQNSFSGLGSVVVPLGSTNFLEKQITRIGWIKGLVLQSDGEALMAVTGFTIAGIPVQIGNNNVPLTMFKYDATRWSQSFSDRLVAFGQSVRVDLANVDGANHTATGAVIMDEANPDAFGRLMEQLILGSFA